MRRALVALLVSLCSTAPAAAQIDISIGIELPAFPQLVVVPGYPVYYAPAQDSNLFFFDGLYWLYARDGWYASSWYNGPWTATGPDDVPLYVLRVPVRYYRQPPAHSRGSGPDGPPLWGQRFGADWERRHGGWERWNREGTPRPAPLPVYQREYGGDRYPQPDRQRGLHDQHYQHQSRDPAVLRFRRALGPPGAAPGQQLERDRNAGGAGDARERRGGDERAGRGKGRQARPEEHPGPRPRQGGERHSER